MINNSSRERLKLAHQIMDKELEASHLGPKTSDSKYSNSEISDIEKKLKELERKMENIDVSSSNEDNDEPDIFKKRLDEALSKGKQAPERPKLTQPPSASKHKKQQPLSSDEDSEDDVEIYAKIQAKKQKVEPVGGAPKKRNNTLLPKPAQQKKKAKESSSMRESVKSFKSNKSRKSNMSRNSNVSRKSNMSRGSLGRNKMGLSGEDMRELELENAKDARKISNLEKEVNHYKRLCRRQEEKLEEYRVMEIQFRSLQANFAKSEQIRKQQKKIIDGLKTKH